MFRAALNLASVEIVLSQNGTSTGAWGPSALKCPRKISQRAQRKRLTLYSSYRMRHQLVEKKNIENKYSLSSPMCQFIGKPLL